MLKRLTPKMEKFCEYIVAGKDGATAYTLAYDTKANGNTIRNESKRLLMRDDITARIEELRRPLYNHARNVSISEREKQIADINERIEICKAKEDEQSLIRYYDMLNKIYSLYKETDAEKTEDHNITVDTDSLKKLLEAQ